MSVRLSIITRIGAIVGSTSHCAFFLYEMKVFTEEKNLEYNHTMLWIGFNEIENKKVKIMNF